MPTQPLTLQVDAEAAKAYHQASDEEKRRVEMLIGLWLKKGDQPQEQSLLELMRQISDEARAKGLTPEALESLMAEDD